MNKIKKQVLIIVLLIAIMFTVISSINQVFASGYEAAMKQALTNTETDKTTGASNAVTNVTATVITSIRIIGVCVAVSMLLVLAMKYMSAAPGEKADIKKSAVVYVVGAIILFAVVGILGIISSFSNVIS